MNSRHEMANKLPIEGAHEGIYGLRVAWMYDIKDKFHELVRYNCPKKCFESKAAWRKRVKAFIREQREVVRQSLKDGVFEPFCDCDFRRLVVSAGIQWSVKHVHIVDRFMDIIKYKEE